MLDASFLVFEQPLRSEAVEIDSSSHLDLPDGIIHGDYRLIGFPYTFKERRVEARFDSLRLGGSRAFKRMLENVNHPRLYPSLRGFLSELEIKKGDKEDHFLPGVSGGAFMDLRTGKLLGIAMGFDEKTVPGTKLGVVLDLTHPVHRVVLRQIKGKVPFALKKWGLAEDLDSVALENQFAKLLLDIFKLLR